MRKCDIPLNRLMKELGSYPSHLPCRPYGVPHRRILKQM